MEFCLQTFHWVPCSTVGFRHSSFWRRLIFARSEQASLSSSPLHVVGHLMEASKSNVISTHLFCYFFFRLFHIFNIEKDQYINSSGAQAGTCNILCLSSSRFWYTTRTTSEIALSICKSILLANRLFITPFTQQNVAWSCTLCERACLEEIHYFNRSHSILLLLWGDREQQTNHAVVHNTSDCIHEIFVVSVSTNHKSFFHRPKHQHSFHFQYCLAWNNVFPF